MINNLTRIKTINIENHIKHYVRFGRPVFTEKTSINQTNEYYRPNQLIGYAQWQAGEYGSRIWRFTIFKTVNPTREKHLHSIEGIRPGMRVILDLEGAVKVRSLLKVINQIEVTGIHPAEVSPAYYGYIHQRIMVKQPLHSYTREQHQSFLKEQEWIS